MRPQGLAGTAVARRHAASRTLEADRRLSALAEPTPLDLPPRSVQSPRTMRRLVGEGSPYSGSDTPSSVMRETRSVPVPVSQEKVISRIYDASLLAFMIALYSYVYLITEFILTVSI